jgi:hypothetical protein
MKVTVEDLKLLLQEQALTKEDCLEKLSISERTFYRLIADIPGINKTDDRAPKYFVNNKEMLKMAGVNNIMEEVIINLAEVGEFDATKGFSTGKGIELTIKDIRIEQDCITLKLEDEKKNIMLQKLDYFENSGLLKQLLFSLSVDTKEPVKLNKKLFLNKKVTGDISFSECFNLRDYVEKEISRFASKEFKYFVTGFSPLTTQIFHLKLSEAVEAELNKNIKILQGYNFLKKQELGALLQANNLPEETKNIFIKNSDKALSLSQIYSESEVVNKAISFLKDTIPEEARGNLVETILK